MEAFLGASRNERISFDITSCFFAVVGRIQLPLGFCRWDIKDEIGMFYVLMAKRLANFVSLGPCIFCDAGRALRSASWCFIYFVCVRQTQMSLSHIYSIGEFFLLFVDRLFKFHQLESNYPCFI